MTRGTWISRADGADPVVVLLAEVLGAVLADLAPGGEVVGGELAVFQAHHLGQVLAQQAEGPPHGDDVDGHEQLVQDQHAGVQGGVGTGVHGFPFVWEPSRRWAVASRRLHPYRRIGVGPGSSFVYTNSRSEGQASAARRRGGIPVKLYRRLV